MKQIAPLCTALIIALLAGLAHAQTKDEYPNGFKYITLTNGKKTETLVENFDKEQFKSTSVPAQDLYKFTKINVWNKITEQSEGCYNNIFVSYSDLPNYQDVFVQGGPKKRLTLPNQKLVIYAKQRCEGKPARTLNMTFNISQAANKTCSATMTENGAHNNITDSDQCDIYSYLQAHQSSMEETIDKMKN